MRKQLVGTIWTLLAMVLLAGAQNPRTGTATFATLQNVGVSRADGGINIEITARGSVTPTVETLASPARIVVDLPDTVMATSRSRVLIGHDGVTGVRIGTDAGKTTRVVVDLDRPCKFELVPGTGDRLTLKLATASAPASAASQNAVSAKTSAPVQSVALAPVTTMSEAENHAANGYTFIEPTFTPKKNTTPIEQPVRTVEAASKFVERPEGNLLPSGNAAQDPSAQPAISAMTQVQNSTPAAVQAQSSAPVAAQPQSSSSDQAMTQPATSQPAMTPPAIQPAVNLAAEQRAHSQSGTAEKKYTGEPISVNLKDVDLKDFFRLIHEISGLNVVLDPDIHGSLTIVLDDVPWDQALDIVLKNNNLSRQLDGNVLRIATVDTLRREAEGRRAQQEAEAMAVDRVTVTRFLSYAHSKDVVNTIKKFLSQRGDVVADDRTNAVIISDIPSTIPAVDRLIQQLDRKTQEVEIEARVISATRSFARDIGTQLGFGWGNNPTAVGGASAVGTSPIIVNNVKNPLYIVNGGQIPLFSNLGATGPTSGFSFVNASNNVRIDAILTMAESRGLLKILSRPRVVTQNNIQAVVKQGIRLPIESAATLGAPATITYVDAFLKLTVTPQITVENTIFLNVDVENTTPDFSNEINNNPTLITQQATTQVLVTDGGTVVIGGVIQSNNAVNISQVPLLGSIPWLGNLFKHQTVTSTNQELIFFITPRVIET